MSRFLFVTVIVLYPSFLAAAELCAPEKVCSALRLVTVRQDSGTSAETPRMPINKVVAGGWTELACDVEVVKRAEGEVIARFSGESLVEVFERTLGKGSQLYLSLIRGSGLVNFELPLGVDDPIEKFVSPSGNVWEKSQRVGIAASGVWEVSVKINRVTGNFVYSDVKKSREDAEDADEETTAIGKCVKMDEKSRKF